MKTNFNLQITAKAEVLSTPIDAAYVNTKHTEVTLDKSSDKYTVSESKIIVYGKPDTPVRKKLFDVVNELALGKVTKDELKSKLPDFISNILDNIEVSVNQVYLIKTSLNVLDNKNEQKVTDTSLEKSAKDKYPTPNEYAFWIDFTISKELMSNFPLKVSTLSLKIWSTGNEKVLEEMKINEINKLLKNAGIDKSSDTPLIESK